MVAKNIAISSSIRNNLLTLQSTQSLIERTQNRLSSNLKVAAVTDDAVAFFQARTLSSRASDYDGFKSSLDQGVSAINAALNALEAVDTLVKQLKGLAQSAQSATTSERVELTLQFKEVGSQIGKLVNDASYQGLNLLNATTSKLKVSFSEKTHNFLQISGFDFNTTAGATGRALFTGANVTFTGSNASVFNFSGVASVNSGFTLIGSTIASQFTNMITNLDAAITKVRSTATSFGTNVAILQTRIDFTKDYVSTLNGGANKLTLADLNEEGANLVALQTRQQLGIQSLAFAGQSEQTILQLFR